MAIANGTCVTFCNQPHESHAGMLLHAPILRVNAMHLSTLRESKTHFGLPWVHPWDNCSKCYMDRQRILCLSNASQHMYPSIFNRLRAIARYWSEIATFSYPLAFNAPVEGVPIGIAGKILVHIELESWGYQDVKRV